MPATVTKTCLKALRPISAPTCGSFSPANNVTADAQFFVRFKSVAITFVRTLVVSAIILMIARTTVGLRVNNHVEFKGLDLFENGECS